MECTICYETRHLYYLCNLCKSGICNNCIKNLEKYKIKKCPFCRNVCQTELKYNFLKRMRYFLYTIFGLFFFIASQTFAPLYLLFQHSRMNYNELYISTYLILFSFIIIQNITIILAVYARLITPYRISIISCYLYYFTVNLFFCLIFTTYNTILSLFIYFYLTIVYFMPLTLVFVLLCKRYFKYCFKYLESIYYKKIKLKILGEIYQNNQRNLSISVAEI